MSHISEMVSLKKLELKNIKLSNVDTLAALPALNELDVSKNYIDHFDSIQNFPELTIVNISDNVASECPGYHGILYNQGAHMVRQN